MPDAKVSCHTPNCVPGSIPTKVAAVTLYSTRSIRNTSPTKKVYADLIEKMVCPLATLPLISMGTPKRVTEDPDAWLEANGFKRVMVLVVVSMSDIVTISRPSSDRRAPNTYQVGRLLTLMVLKVATALVDKAVVVSGEITGWNSPDFLAKRTEPVRKGSAGIVTPLGIIVALAYVGSDLLIKSLMRSSTA